MRIADNMHDDVIEIILNRIYEYANNYGLELDEIHFEYGTGRTDVRALRSFLRRKGATHVIIPSIEQITEHIAVQAAVTSTIVLGAGAMLHQTAEETRDS